MLLRTAACILIITLYMFCVRDILDSHSQGSISLYSIHHSLFFRFWSYEGVCLLILFISQCVHNYSRITWSLRVRVCLCKLGVFTFFY